MSGSVVGNMVSYVGNRFFNLNQAPKIERESCVREVTGGNPVIGFLNGVSHASLTSTVGNIVPAHFFEIAATTAVISKGSRKDAVIYLGSVLTAVGVVAGAKIDTLPFDIPKSLLGHLTVQTAKIAAKVNAIKESETETIWERARIFGLAVSTLVDCVGVAVTMKCAHPSLLQWATGIGTGYACYKLVESAIEHMPSPLGLISRCCCRKEKAV